MKRRKHSNDKRRNKRRRRHCRCEWCQLGRQHASDKRSESAEQQVEDRDKEVSP